jgi:hypothetical protein
MYDLVHLYIDQLSGEYPQADLAGQARDRGAAQALAATRTTSLR